MTLHPDILARAQAEIDSVIGLDRLPTLADRRNLPYIEAVLKESLRWRNVIPVGVLMSSCNCMASTLTLHWLPMIGLVHTSETDDVHAGYRIPKGAYVLPNIWYVASYELGFHDIDRILRRKFAHDPESYQNPDEFFPDRFIGANGRAPEKDPREFVFGFGRRYVSFTDRPITQILRTCLQNLCRPSLR